MWKEKGKGRETKERERRQGDNVIHYTRLPDPVLTETQTHYSITN